MGLTLGLDFLSSLALVMLHMHIVPTAEKQESTDF